jgi:hypothetical protein
MRDIETIDSELGLVAALRHAAREPGGPMPSIAVADELLDKRRELTGHPRLTRCLGCADRHRSDRDTAWPAIAAQLRDTIGVADRATLLGTAALALSQVNRVIAAVRGDQAVPDPGPPQALNATLEFDLNSPPERLLPQAVTAVRETPGQRPAFRAASRYQRNQLRTDCGRQQPRVHRRASLI